MKIERLEAFSDGVFAVAITLLVLDLAVPLTQGSLLTALGDEWPNFAAFALSFVIIGIVWVNHHAVLAQARHADRPLLFINLAALMSVVLLPFSTSLFARYLVRGGDNSHVAAAIFSASALFMAITFDLLYAWIATHPGLRKSDVSGTTTTRAIVRFGLGIGVYAMSIGVAFLSPLAVFGLQSATALYYVVDQSAARAQRRA